ncbi:MAG: hypothetical protein JXR77_18785 [Lentisphaeria bacterium]|nr:hypothetical protein [Lentisphaeria bacterium]
MADPKTTPQPPAAGPQPDPHLAAVLQDAFRGVPPLESATAAILRRVTAMEARVRRWPARWLFAVPLVQVAVLLWLRIPRPPWTRLFAAGQAAVAGHLWEPVKQLSATGGGWWVEAARVLPALLPGGGFTVPVLALGLCAGTLGTWFVATRRDVSHA